MSWCSYAERHVAQAIVEDASPGEKQRRALRPMPLNDWHVYHVFCACNIGKGRHGRITYLHLTTTSELSAAFPRSMYDAQDDTTGDDIYFA
jgi:hypothetical protein